MQIALKLADTLSAVGPRIRRANYLTQMLPNSLGDIYPALFIHIEARFGYLSLSRLFHLNNKWAIKQNCQRVRLNLMDLQI